mgnify:CR=1 FL=1
MVACLLAAILVGAAYLVGFKGSLWGWQPFGPSTNLTDEATSDTQQSSTTDTDQGTKNDVEPGTGKTTDQVPVSGSLTATFTELSQAGGYVTFKGVATDSTASGTCSLVLTNPNDKPITRTMGAAEESGSAACGPIRILETEFSFIGEWTATFRYYVNDTQAVTERKIFIQ